jgi:L-ascorbate metabolism protein UlaG (beta-lactamase superfamily)
MIRGPMKHLSIQLAAASLILFLACTEKAPTPPERTAENQVEITYLANEGFLLTSANHKVLIDGLFREGVDGYAKLSPQLRETIETAQSPFDTVDVVLASHLHDDHFHALAVCRFLESNPLAEFVSTLQALAKLRSDCDNPAALAGRVRPGLQSDGSPAPFVLDDLRAEAVLLHHGAGSPVQNIGFVIEIGGLTVLHMGDSQANADDLRAAGFGERSIDLAFVPFWYLIDKRWTPAIDFLQPAGIVAMHLPVPGSPDLQAFNGYDGLVEIIVESFPRSVVFAEPFETRTF